MTVETLVHKFKVFGQSSGRMLQGAVLKTLLIAVYLFGIGLTRLLTEVFSRRLLSPWRIDKDRESFWQDAEGYELSPDRYRKQV